MTGRKFILALIVSLFAAACAHAGPSPATLPLSRAIAQEAQARGFSGNILVQRGDVVLYRASFGPADRAFNVDAQADTRFRIASITKLFTSVMVMQLVEEGRLDLESPIATWLPDYPGGGADRMTLAHLLNHTSGLAQYDRISGLEQALAEGIEAYQRPMTSAQLLQRCCSDALVRPPGEAFEYNNADYLLLGRIIERVTGRSYEDALTERLLRPLGLADTGIADQSRIIARLAPTYYWRDDREVLMNDLPVYFQNWDAAGGMYSTADDLAAFASALFEGRLLGAASLERMLTPGLDDYGYGLWSYAVPRDGRRIRVAKRPGSIMGANASLYRLLDEGTTIVLLANTNRADLDAFVQYIADRLIERSAAPSPERTGRPSSEAEGIFTRSLQAASSAPRRR